MKYAIYEISPSIGCYAGVSLVAANTADEANSYISDFKAKDKTNVQDSFGYSSVEECDKLDNIYAECPGIVYYGIYYRG